MSQHYNITSRNSQDQAFLTNSRINWNNKGCWLCCVNIMDLASFGGILLSRVLTAHVGKQKAATPFWNELNHNPLHGFCISENLSSYWGRSKQIVLAPWSDYLCHGCPLELKQPLTKLRVYVLFDAFWNTLLMTSNGY